MLVDQQLNNVILSVCLVGTLLVEKMFPLSDSDICKSRVWVVGGGKYTFGSVNKAYLYRNMKDCGCRL